LNDWRIVDNFCWVKDEARGWPDKSDSHCYWFYIIAPGNIKIEGFSQEPDYERGFPDQAGRYWRYVKYTECGAIKQWMEKKDQRYQARLRLEAKTWDIQEERDQTKQAAQKGISISSNTDSSSHCDQCITLSSNAPFFQKATPMLQAASSSSSSSVSSAAPTIVRFEPHVAFVAYYSTRQEAGDKFTVERNDLALCITCVPANCNDPLLDTHLDQLKRFLKKQLQEIGQTAVLQREGYCLMMKDCSAEVLSATEQLLRDIANEHEATSSFACIVS
jgi:hypothetical protein